MTQVDNNEGVQEEKEAQPETQSDEREEPNQGAGDSGKDTSRSSNDENADQAKSSREATLDALASLGRSNEKKPMSSRNKTIAIVAGAIVVAIVVVIVLFATHVICFHDEVTEATCTEPPTCTTCNRAQGEALGHTWVDATCTEPKTCSVCGETEGEALGHTPGEWVPGSVNFNTGSRGHSQKCTVCKETVDAKSEPVSSFIQGDKFMFLPTDFSGAMNYKLDEMTGNSLTAKIKSDNEAVSVGITNTSSAVAVFMFSEDAGQISSYLSGNEDSANTISSIVSYTEDEDNIARVLLATVEVCDPSLSFDDAKDLSKEIFNSALTKKDVIRNGLKYALAKSGSSYISTVRIA